MMAAVELTYKGEIKGRDMTKWGSETQLDFSAELSKAKASGAEALWAFYPGKAGGAFVSQFMQAGLADTMKLYTVYTLDGISLPKMQEAGLTAALGSRGTQNWSPDMDNAANQKFVSDFRFHPRSSEPASTPPRRRICSPRYCVPTASSRKLFTSHRSSRPARGP